MTDEKNLNFLKNILPSLLENLPRDKRINIYWQHDGASAHNSKAVQQYLNQIYKRSFLVIFLFT